MKRQTRHDKRDESRKMVDKKYHQTLKDRGDEEHPKHEGRLQFQRARRDKNQRKHYDATPSRLHHKI